MKSLVLGGGGAFGSFEAGFLYTIFDKIEFDKIYGTSVGGLNAVLMAQAYLNGNPEIIKNLWTNLVSKNSDIYKKNYLALITMRSPLSFSPLRKIIKDKINIKEILKMEKQIFLTSCDMISGNSITFSNQNGLSEKEFVDALIASASVPPLFPPVEIKNHVLVDGGVRDNVPLMSVINNPELDSILVILCRDKQIPAKNENYKSILRISERVVDVMMNEITKNDLSGVLQVNKMLKEIKEKNGWLSDKSHINIDVVSPGKNLEGECLKFDQAVLQQNFAKGVQKGHEYLENLN